MISVDVEALRGVLRSVLRETLAEGVAAAMAALEAGRPHGLLSRSEAAKYLGISTSTLAVLVAEGYIARVEHPRGGTGYSVAELDSYIERHTSRASARPRALSGGRDGRPHTS